MAQRAACLQMGISGKPCGFPINHVTGRLLWLCCLSDVMDLGCDSLLGFYMATRHISSRIILLAMISVAVAFSSKVSGQANPPKRGVNVRRTPARNTPKVNIAPRASRVLLETSAPIANLLQRAEDAIVREDWKLAIDSMQRVIDAPDGSLVLLSKDEIEATTLYQSASRYAAGRIASLPPEGLAAYRVLYDGKAKRLYEQAIAAHQADGLWTIAHRYTGTSYGGDALETLASWALDENQPSQALRLLHDLRTLVRVQEQDEQRIAVMESVAQTMLGATDYAHKTMTPLIPAVAKRAPDHPWHQIVVHAVSAQAINRYAVDKQTYKSWPMAHGVLVGNGHLPAVSPEITSKAPWRYELDERNFSSSIDFGNKPGQERLAFPYYRFAIEGDRVFLRTRRGIVALDADDLSMLWQSPSLKKSFPVSVESALSPGAQLSRMYESVSGDIAVEGDFLYTVEPAVPGLTSNDAVFAPPPVAPAGRRGPKIPGSTSRLVARDVDTGKISWSRGGGYDQLDPLADVRFRAVPIVVGAQLWVPYERQRELFLGVLDPATGEDISHVFLCSAPTPSSLVNVPLTPVYNSGVMYMASGYGVFYAIDVARYDVIWAHRLDVHHPSVDRWGQPWETGAPMVARGLVLFPSLLDGALYALDVIDGTRVWSHKVDSATFIVAADAKHVWLAGRSVTCLETGSGEAVWTRELPFTQTGRATLVGETILIPTIKSVLALDAGTGELIKADTLAEKQHPLGDIVSYRSSLYSVDPSFVRRFPDLSDMYPAAKARLSDDPEDVKNRLQLARLEILHGQPEAAISLLESRDDRFDGANQQMRARTLVDAWLSLASEGKGESDRMDKVLNNADKQATTSAQKVRVAQAKSSWQQAGNNSVAAAQTIWGAAASLPDDKNVELGGLAKGAAQVVLRRELYEVVRTMDQASKETFEQYTNTRLNELVSQHPASQKWSDTFARTLRAVSELGAPPATAQRALLENAKRNMLRGRLELAEHDFVACASMDASPSLARAAIMYVIKLHTHVLQSPPRAVAPWIAALMKSSPSEPVPGAYEWFEMLGPKPSTSSTLSAWLAQNRAIESESLADGETLPLQQPAKNERKSWFFVPETSGDLATGSDYRLGHQRGLADDAGFMPVIVFVREDRLAALHPMTGQVLWQADMRFPEVFPNASMFNRNIQTRRNNQPLPKRSFVVDGQVVVVASREGLCGIGLLTGKRLWARPFELLPQVAKPEVRDNAMAAQDGMIAAMHTGGRLSLLRAADGTTVWERDMYGETVMHIWLTPSRVITADARMQRVHIVDRENGRLVRQVLFEQPDDDGDLVSVVIAGGYVYGPTHSTRVDGLQAVDLISGEDVWQRELDRPLVQLFELNEHTLGVALLGGGGYVIDIAKGHEATSFLFERSTRLMDMKLVDDAIIAVYAERVNRRQAISMKALDLVSGEQRWLRQDLAVVLGKAMTIHLQGKTIFAVLDTATGPRAQDTQYNVAAINAESGLDEGWREELPRTSSNSGYRFDGDLDVRPDSVTVGIASAIHGFVLEVRDSGMNRAEIEP